MRIEKLEPKRYKEYYKFYCSIYKNRPEKKDDMSSMLKNILKGKSALNKRLKLQPVLVYEDGEPIMGTLLAQVDDMPAFIQMSFFEAALESKIAFSMLLKMTQEVGQSWGATKIAAGLNIHVNYGLGFLTSHHDSEASFGMNYNPKFYNNLFLTHDFNGIDLITYKQNMKAFILPVSEALLKRVRSRYNVRPINFTRFKQEIATYTRLNNDAFQEHLFYYKRYFEEDYELFKSFKLLLKPENLLIVEQQNEPLGFMLWYPDYNELIPDNKKLSIKTVIDSKLLNKPMTTFKIVEIGIVKKAQKSGAILALFDALNTLTKNQFDYFESSWILKDNYESSNFGLKWSDGVHKTYAAYTRPLWI